MWEVQQSISYLFFKECKKKNWSDSLFFRFQTTKLNIVQIKCKVAMTTKFNWHKLGDVIVVHYKSKEDINVYKCELCGT